MLEIINKGKEAQSSVKETQMEKSENIILFPLEKIARPENVKLGSRNPTNMNEVISSIANIHHVHINETIESVIPTLFTQLSAAGFDIADDDNIKDGAFIVEALRSVLCKHYTIPHPFQKIATDIFETEDTGGLRIVSSIHVDFESNKAKS